MSTLQTNPPYRWTYRGDHKILVAAIGFGIGPKIAAENLLIDLKAAKEDEPIEWHDTGLEQILPLLEVKLLLNFGVIAPLPEFKAQHRVWVDCVDWLRTTVPAHVQAYDLLLREAFFESPPGGDRGDLAKWHAVQPILRIPKRASTPDHDLILMSFGGIATPYSTPVHATDMPMAFLRGVCQFLDDVLQKRVVAFLPDSLLDDCEHAGIMHERLDLRSLDRKVFLEAMTRCGLLVCQPGLYTPFEAMNMKVPFALTYPMSFTQDRQAAMFRKMGVECCECDWVNSNNPSGAPTEDIEAVEKTWFTDSARAWEKKSPERLSNTVESWLRNLVEKSRFPGASPKSRKKEMAAFFVKKILGKDPPLQPSLFDPKDSPDAPIQP